MPAPEFLGNEMPRQGAAILRSVHGNAQRAGLVFDDLAADHPGWIDDIDHRGLPRVENGRIEQKPGEHFIVADRLGDVINAQKACRRRFAVVRSLAESRFRRSDPMRCCRR